MDVKKQQQMLKQDPNIGKLWTERYHAMQRDTQEEWYQAVNMGFDKVFLREYKHNNKLSYSVVTSVNYTRENTNLNDKLFTTDFNRYRDLVMTGIRLNKLNHMYPIWKSSEDAKWQMMVLYNTDTQKLVVSTICYRNTKWCERKVGNNNSTGNLGTYIEDRGYREIPYSKWYDRDITDVETWSILKEIM